MHKTQKWFSVWLKVWDERGEKKLIFLFLGSALASFFSQLDAHAFSSLNVKKRKRKETGRSQVWFLPCC